MKEAPKPVAEASWRGAHGVDHIWQGRSCFSPARLSACCAAINQATGGANRYEIGVSLSARRSPLLQREGASLLVRLPSQSRPPCPSVCPAVVSGVWLGGGGALSLALHSLPPGSTFLRTRVLASASRRHRADDGARFRRHAATDLTEYLTSSPSNHAVTPAIASYQPAAPPRSTAPSRQCQLISHPPLQHRRQCCHGILPLSSNLLPRCRAARTPSPPRLWHEHLTRHNHT